MGFYKSHLTGWEAAQLAKRAAGVCSAAFLVNPQCFINAADIPLKDRRENDHGPMSKNEMGASILSNSVTRIRQAGRHRLLPWFVVCGWLIGSLVAFEYFELRVPLSLWCNSSGGVS